MARLPEPLLKFTGTVPTFSDLPVIPLSQDEELWLRRVEQEFKQGNEVDVRVIGRNMKFALSPNFDPKAIDKRLVSQDGGYHITLFGIWTLDHNTDWLGKVDLVLRYIQQITLTDLTLDKVPVDVFAAKLHLTPHDVSTSLDLAYSVGMCWVTAGTTSNMPTEGKFPKQYTEFSLAEGPTSESASEKVTRSYEHYAGIRDTIIQFNNKGGGCVSPP